MKKDKKKKTSTHNKKKIKKKMKSKTNILEIPGGTLGYIIVPIVCGQSNTIVNLSTWSSSLLLGLMRTSFTAHKYI
jgi:hypothetical protein